MAEPTPDEALAAIRDGSPYRMETDDGYRTVLVEDEQGKRIELAPWQGFRIYMTNGYTPGGAWKWHRKPSITFLPPQDGPQTYAAALASLSRLLVPEPVGEGL
jgi:hypothetical protein